jgi:Xaa-Pro aminopeptidase
VQAEEFARRRAALAALLPPDSVAIVPAQAVTFVTGVIPHPYRQDADFAYLTGVQQQAVAVIAAGGAAAAGGGAGSAAAAAAAPARIGGGSETPPPSSSSFTYALFVPQPDRDRETWDGAWLGRDAAVDVFGCGSGGAHYAHELQARLVPLLASARAVFFDLDRPSGYMYAQVRAALEEVARRGAAAGNNKQQRPPSSAFASSPPRVHALRPLLHRLRWVKSPAEVALMASSASAAADAVTACMAATGGGTGASPTTTTEAALAALFDYRCRLRGASRLAYPPVVASGADALTIHYSRNDKPCRRGDMVLMDAGCELHGYSSDVTRTWPVSGRFSGAQRDLYGAVLSVRERVLAAAVDGGSLARLHALCVQLLSQALLDLGILPQGGGGGGKGRGSGSSPSFASAEAVVSSGAYKEFFCHSVGHALGLDVHDSAAVGPARPLEPGVVLALEPALYIPDDPGRYGAFAGLGVRLEDDVVVSPGGLPPVVLSAAAPVEIDDVEHAVRGG